MNILHIHDQIVNKGGTEVYLADLQEFLPSFGCNSHWISIQQENEALMISEYRVGVKKLTRQAFKNYIAEFIKEKEISLICIHNLFDTGIITYLLTLKPVIKFSHSPVVVCPGRDKYWRFSGRPCSKPFGLHCFFHVYAQGCSNRHPKRIWKAWHFVQEELVHARKDYRKVIVMSDYNRNGLLECGVPEEKIVVNPYFTRQVMSSSGKVNENLRLLYIGRIINGKGVPEMLNSVEPILKRHDQVQLDIIGDGLQMEEIKNSIKAKNLEDKIILHGWMAREEIDRYLANCYLVIFPSIYPESFGIVGIEGMMNAKPVIAFDVGGVSTWLKNGETGYLLPAGDSALMSQAIEKLLTNEKLYQEMSSKARSVALEQFTPKVHMEKLAEVFREAISTVV